MFKKLNTNTLIIILVVLGGLFFLNKYFFQGKKENTFRAEFVKIDTSTVTQILIYPKAEQGKEIKITKTGARWDLQKDKIKTDADTNAIRGLLSMFADIKSLSLAGQDKSTWKDLQVTDSLGTRIKFLTGDNKKYDMIVGKFGYNPSSRNGMTYIRHADEEMVYAIEGYLSFSVNQGYNSWRNKTVVHGSKDNWTSLTFSYPADSSFQLNKQENSWTVNGQNVDSTKTEQYLSQLANLQSSGFVDGYTPSSTPVFTLTISGNNQPAPITVQAFPADSTQKFIYHSSLNPDVYFSESQSHFADQLFVGRKKFLKEEESAKKK
ncbi:MAG: DUF4340 domain-containing protein [Bacteroidia bacterium]|nr:DUF4340 domain-containing protein [Bacteroidia bacterium]